ncbi:hypothetical protein [Mucilaginibacter flavidus]|uniref:hypothetical protein n=1 Tax=Mucilaginibacter flavidus TaxID=2949309 RepID=UPI002092EE76|nr:hypothetical protein [Mucilaginibacter flavidus]MCO5949098.1 hypothetical protein [Mucilaginibacter flavidus]
MKSSILDSSHHFYILCFESQQIKNVDQIIDLIDDSKESAPIITSSNQFVHLQVEIEKAYGSESLLEVNLHLDKDGKKLYTYDFYLGIQIINGKPLYFICYLYSKLGKYIDDCFAKRGIIKTVYKAKINALLQYMNQRIEKGYEAEEKEGLLISITRYAADVKEESNANKINIIGKNPLQSKIFDVLNNTEGITIEPVSLKLKCTETSSEGITNSLPLAIDRLGNFRFWLYRNGQSNIIPLIQPTLQFFSEINALEDSTFVNTRTMLEEDEK